MSEQDKGDKAFDRIIAEKFQQETLGNSKPQWNKMRPLFLTNGLRHLSVWNYFVIAALASSLSLNSYFIFKKQKSTTSRITNKNPALSSNLVQVRHKTITITDTVYIHKVIYQKKNMTLSSSNKPLKSKNPNRPLAENEYTSGKNVLPSSILGNVNKGFIKKSNIKQAHEKELIYKDLRIKNAKQPHEVPRSTSFVKNTSTAKPVKNKKNLVASSAKGKNVLALAELDTTSQPGVSQPKKIKKSKKLISLHLNLGVGVETSFLTTKDGEGSSFGYGFTFEFKLNKHFGIYSGFWFLSQHISFKNGLLDYSHFNKVLSNPSIVYDEAMVTNKILKVPLGVMANFPLNNRFLLKGEGAINYIRYLKQDFLFKTATLSEKDIFVNEKNTYSGFGSVSFGIGASYLWKKEFSISLYPEIEIPISKMGAEKVKYGYVTVRLTFFWHL